MLLSDRAALWRGQSTVTCGPSLWRPGRSLRERATCSRRTWHRHGAAAALPDPPAHDADPLLPPPPPSPPAGPPPPPPPSGTQLLVASTATYGLMTAGALFFGSPAPWVAPEAGWQLGPALATTAGMLVYPVLGVKLADKVPGFGEMRQLFKTTIIPTLETLPFWGIAVLALGAGVGEECLFRGLLQSGLISRLEGWGAASGVLSQGAATALGLGTASLVLGALHAVTPTYFTLATVAGAVFGIEYLILGLPAAAFTHALYDFIALLYITREWGSQAAGKQP